MLVLEAARATDEAAAGSRPPDSVASAVAAHPFAERMSTDSLTSADSSASQPSIDFAKV